MPVKQQESVQKSMQITNSDTEHNLTRSSNEGPSIAVIEDANNEYPSTKKMAVIMAGLMMVMFMMSLDRTIIATAIPVITDEFHSLGDVGWYGSAYLLTSCSFQLFFGKLYTFYNIKAVLLSCIGIFLLGSVICGSASNSNALIVGRAISGLGSAGIFNGIITVVTYVVPLSKRPALQGVVGAVFGLSSVLGPLLGGALTQNLSWRWCFYINLPIGAVAVAIVIFVLHLNDTNTKSHKAEATTLYEKFRQTDPLGTLCLLPAIVCLVLALQWGGATYPWSNGRIIALFILSGIFFIAFIAVQILMPETATIKSRIITQRSIASGVWYMLFFGPAMFLLTYYLPIYFQAIQGVSAIESGVHNLGLLLSMILGAFTGGFVCKKLGYYTPLMIASSIITSIGIGLISTFKPDSRPGVWIGFQVIAGYGIGLGMQQPMLACQVVLSKKDVPVGTSLIAFVQQLGGAISLAIGQTVFNNRLVTGASSIPGLDASAIVNAGATHLRTLVKPEDMGLLLQVYNSAIVHVFYVSLALACLTIFGSLTMEWKSIKQKKPLADAEKLQKAEESSTNN